LEVVDEQRHQEKYLGCMTTGKGIIFFPPADNTLPIESKKGAVPVHIRSDNGPEFIARILRKWLEERYSSPKGACPLAKSART
jgi:hypothetical protein